MEEKNTLIAESGEIVTGELWVYHIIEVLSDDIGVHGDFLTARKELCQRVDETGRQD